MDLSNLLFVFICFVYICPLELSRPHLHRLYREHGRGTRDSHRQYPRLHPGAAIR